MSEKMIKTTTSRPTRQQPRSGGVLLRAFVPDAPAFSNDLAGYDRLLPGAIKLAPMCRGRGAVTVLWKGERVGRSSDYVVGVYPVSAGDELRTIRANRPEHRQTFDSDGIVVDLRVSAELEPLARRIASLQGIGVAIGFERLGGAWRLDKVPGQPGRADVFHVTSAQLRAVEFTTGREKDPGTKVWLID